MQAELFTGCDGAVDANSIGNLTSVKMSFQDTIALSNAGQLGLKTEYEIFRVFECVYKRHSRSRHPGVS